MTDNATVKQLIQEARTTIDNLPVEAFAKALEEPGVLRAMGIRPYERAPKPLDALQPPRIAKVTGASVNTVKERIARMTEAGIIGGYHAVPNLRHLGLMGKAFHLNFATDDAKDAAL